MNELEKFEHQFNLNLDRFMIRMNKSLYLDLTDISEMDKEYLIFSDVKLNIDSYLLNINDFKKINRSRLINLEKTKQVRITSKEMTYRIYPKIIKYLQLGTPRVCFNLLVIKGTTDGFI